MTEAEFKVAKKAEMAARANVKRLQRELTNARLELLSITLSNG